jgi:hypothetical protein
MKKFDKWIHYFLILGLPVVVGFFIWEYFHLEPELIKAATLAQREMIVKEYAGGWWDYAGYFLMMWFFLAVVTTIRLLISNQYREECLSKLGMIKERDEREVEITGFASKFSMIASIALLLFLLFFNSLNVGLKKYNDRVIDSEGKPKNGTLSLGFGFKVLDDKAIVYKNEEKEKEFLYKELPISKTGIIILMIFWQVGTFHLAARKKAL